MLFYVTLIGIRFSFFLTRAIDTVRSVAAFCSLVSEEAQKASRVAEFLFHEINERMNE